MDNLTGNNEHIINNESVNNELINPELEEQAKRDFLDGIVLNMDSRKSINVHNIYTCDTCNKKFPKEDTFNLHLLKQPCILQQNRTNCTKCGLFFATRVELVSHILTPEHRIGINNYINNALTSKSTIKNNNISKSTNNVSNNISNPTTNVLKKNPIEEKKKKILNKLDILNSVDFALNDEERTQIRSIVENSVSKNISTNMSNSCNSNTKNITTSTNRNIPRNIPYIPENTIKITYSSGDIDVFENVRISSNTIINNNLPPLNNISSAIPNTTNSSSNITTTKNSEKQQEVILKEPTTYQKQVLQFLKKCQNDTDRKGAFLKLLMKSQKKHQDAFDGFTTLINRVSGITPEAKADYISVIADFEAFLIGLAARGQKTYNDMEIFHLVSLINGAK